MESPHKIGEDGSRFRMISGCLPPSSSLEAALWRYDAAFSPVQPSFVYFILKLPTRLQCLATIKSTQTYTVIPCHQAGGEGI